MNQGSIPNLLDQKRCAKAGNPSSRLWMVLSCEQSKAPNMIAYTGLENGGATMTTQDFGQTLVFTGIRHRKSCLVQGPTR